jgi:hypothetical protein
MAASEFASIKKTDDAEPSAWLGFPAGLATAGGAFAMLKTGVVLTTPAAGAVEWDGTRLYLTNGSGRQTVAFTSDLHSALSLAASADALLALGGTGGQVVSLKAQAAGRFLAGPATGADAAPTFRAIDGADLPEMSADKRGAVPATGAPTGTKFLCDDKTFKSVGAAAGVASLNALTGALSIVAGANVTVTEDAETGEIAIAAESGAPGSLDDVRLFSFFRGC